MAIVQDSSCLTVLTWNQFEPRLPEFGPRKMPTGESEPEMLRRLIEPLENEHEEKP